MIRFDSLDPRRGGRSFTFRGKLSEAVAFNIDDVMPALLRVGREVEQGRFAAGFISYEAAPAFDQALAVQPPVPGLPLLHFEIFEERLEIDPLTPVPEREGSYVLGELHGSSSPDEYEAEVRAVQELIAAGDTYQVNLTLRLRGAFEGAPLALYSHLIQAQRSAFCAYLPYADHTIVSASPELFFRYSGRDIELRPMKGTRGRGRSSEEDTALAAELGSSAKDRAENLMIVDLLRNDLGRIAEFGSVTVPRLFEVEQYPTVHQLTSTVTGTLREEVGIAEIFSALFPSGSVTGAPKVRTSEIIREIERSPRGPYTGAIGFIGPDEGVFSVAIRTAVIDRRSGTIEVGVGSGITADSDPASEYRETMGKGDFLTHRPADLSLIESLRLEPSGQLVLLDPHLARLGRSAGYFDFPFDRTAAEELLATTAGRAAPRTYKVRLLLAPNGAMTVELEPIPEISPEVRLGIAAARVDPRNPLLYHKTTRRDLYRTALEEAEEVDDVAFLNTSGEVTETRTSNIVIRIGGDLVTPPLESGILPGVQRATELTRGVIRERVLREQDLRAADEIYLINSVRGWRKAHLVG